MIDRYSNQLAYTHAAYLNALDLRDENTPIAATSFMSVVRRALHESGADCDTINDLFEEARFRAIIDASDLEDAQ